MALAWNDCCYPGITGRPPKTAISKTALGAEERVPWGAGRRSGFRDDRLRGNGYEIAAIETSVRAVDIFDWEPPLSRLHRLRSRSNGLNANCLIDAITTFVCLCLVSNTPSMSQRGGGRHVRTASQISLALRTGIATKRPQIPSSIAGKIARRE